MPCMKRVYKDKKLSVHWSAAGNKERFTDCQPVVVFLHSQTCLARKRFTKTNKRRYIGLQPGMKSGLRPADKPLINRGSTAGFVPPTVYIGTPLIVLPKNCSEKLSSMPWKARKTVVSCANKPVGVPSCRARPAQPPRCAPPDPTRPWCVRILDSTRRFT